MSKCTSIEKIDNIAGVGDLLRVTVDGTTQALWFYDYAAALQFVNQDVIVDYRKDVYNGQIQQFINTFVVPTRVSTLDKKENISLRTDTVDNFSDISFNEIVLGDTRSACKVFCLSQELKSSSKAVWFEFTIRDRLMHVATLRLFNYDDVNAKFAGHYILTDLTKSAYGFQSNLIRVVEGDCPPNPEIALAEQFVLNIFSQDPVALDYITKIGLFDAFKQLVDFEPGYGIVRLATELGLSESLDNLVDAVDTVALRQAILCSFGYVTRPTSILSKNVNNVLLSQNFQWPNRPLVVQCVDCGEDGPVEKSIISMIKKMADTLLKKHKGVSDAWV